MARHENGTLESDMTEGRLNTLQRRIAVLEDHNQELFLRFKEQAKINLAITKTMQEFADVLADLV